MYAHSAQIVPLTQYMFYVITLSKKKAGHNTYASFSFSASEMLSAGSLC